MVEVSAIGHYYFVLVSWAVCIPSCIVKHLIQTRTKKMVSTCRATSTSSTLPCVVTEGRVGMLEMSTTVHKSTSTRPLLKTRNMSDATKQAKQAALNKIKENRKKARKQQAAAISDVDTAVAVGPVADASTWTTQEI